MNILEKSKEIKSIFKNVINLAIDNQFIQRNSKVNALNFLQTIIYSQFNNRDTSLEDYCTAFELISGKSISRQGFSNRINENTNYFFNDIIYAIFKIILNIKTRKIKLLNDFNKIKVLDSSYITISDSLKEEYPNNSDSGNKAYLKLQTLYNPLDQNIEMIDITAANLPDNKYASKDLIYNYLEKNDLLLFDLGYSNMDFFIKLIQRGTHILSRYHPLVKIYYKR